MLRMPVSMHSKLISFYIRHKGDLQMMIKYLSILFIYAICSSCGAVTMLDNRIASSDEIFVADIEAGKRISSNVDTFLYQVNRTRDILTFHHPKDFCIKTNAKLRIGGIYLMFANSSHFMSERESGCALTLVINKVELSPIELLAKKGSYYAKLNNEDIAYPFFPSVLRVNQIELSSANNKEGDTLCLGSVLPFDDLLSYIEKRHSPSREAQRKPK